MEYANAKDVPRRSYLAHVDMRSRQSMADYLANHFRYPTANSWNGSTSYACNMKLTHARLPSEIDDRLYGLMQTEDFYRKLNVLVDKFNKQHGYKWQAGWNGRSGGYLVLYQGDTKPSEHKSVCTVCGQRNFRSVSETGTRCGRCGNDARVDFAEPPVEIVTYPGRNTDQGMEAADYLEWTTDELRDRTALVKSFDALADKIAEKAIQLALRDEAREVIELVPQTVTRMFERRKERDGDVS